MRQYFFTTRTCTVLIISLILLSFSTLWAQGGPPPEVQKAQALLQAKDYDGAIKTLEDFFQRNPTAVQGRILLGIDDNEDE